MQVALDRIDYAKRLLSEGMKQRKVAMLCGLSRATVCKISNGRYVVKTPRRTSATFEPIYPAERCGRCGGLSLFVPCKVCFTLYQIKQQKAAKNKDNSHA